MKKTESQPKKIVYLFGAGATHAELADTEEDSASVKFLEKKGLLLGPMSKRIMAKAIKNKKYLRDIEMVSSSSGSMNIELLISLIENCKISNWQEKTTYLKNLVKKDIETILTKARRRKFYLHKALLELHQHEKIKNQEELTGLISLNYDSVLDEAYKATYKISPNYCLSSIKDEGVPLLKLHGSFNWDSIKIRGRKRMVQIIPLGANKNYLHVPYNFIWNRALDILIDCDILRVIGCSLSPNDIHLIDLLFKAHLEKGKALEIQIISSEKRGTDAQANYGFLPEIKRLSEIEPPLIPTTVTENAFKTWLKYKSLNVIKENNIKFTKYLKKVIN